MLVQDRCADISPLAKLFKSLPPVLVFCQLEMETHTYLVVKLRTADEAKILQQKQLMHIVDNIGLPIPSHAQLFESVLTV